MKKEELRKQFEKETGRNVFIRSENLCWVQSAEYVEWLESRQFSEIGIPISEEVKKKIFVEGYNRGRALYHIDHLASSEFAEGCYNGFKVDHPELFQLSQNTKTEIFVSEYVIKTVFNAGRWAFAGMKELNDNEAFDYFKECNPSLFQSQEVKWKEITELLGKKGIIIDGVTILTLVEVFKDNGYTIHKVK